MNKLPIFHDPSGKRWRWISTLSAVLGVLAVGLIIVFVLSILDTPAKDLMAFKSVRTHLAGFASKSSAASSSAAIHKPPVKHGTYIRKREGTPGASPLALGFYVNWDESSYASLSRNIDKLDALVPEWLHLPKGEGALVEVIDQKVIDLVKTKSKDTHFKIFPLINNYAHDEWDADALAYWLGTPANRTRLVEMLSTFVEKNNFHGVTVDFEGLPNKSQPDLLAFMGELRTAFSARGWRVLHSVPFANKAWNLPRFAQTSDYLILMAYEQNFAGGKAGAIADQAWFEKSLDKQMRQLDPTRTIIALGTYGYDWKDGKNADEADQVTYQEAMLAARDSEAKIEFGSSMNPHFGYEEDGDTHEVWFMDAVTAYNQVQAARAYHPAGYALWRMGAEDPSVWQFFTRQNLDQVPNPQWVAKLEDIHFDYDVDFEGAGEILQIIASPTQGKRELKANAEGLIEDVAYTKFPSAYVIRRTGDQDPKAVALTFDDGPDPKWTPQILEILKEKKVPATFFIIGQNANRNSSLLKRVFDEGHELGNHTYTHPNLGTVSSQVVDLELLTTERLVESVTGHQMRLWRAPYFGDAEPKTPDQIEPILEAQRKFNNIAVGLRVDPKDWDVEHSENGPPVTAESILQNTIESVTTTDAEKRGQIVLLHDSGGDRSATIAALPHIIDELHARGYHFVTAGTMAGLTAAQSMPPAPTDAAWTQHSNAVVFSIAEVVQWLVYWLFTAGIALGIARIVLITALAVVHRFKVKPIFTTTYQPFVSVVVPAYNEETVIARTINTLLQSDYEGEYEIIVVDDGSPDRTFEVVNQQFGAHPKVKSFQRVNGGKAAALNFGIDKAQGDIIIALDADTLFAHDSIRLLARHFENPQVGAVAGNAKVGNRINLVTRWQALEYILSQNLDRRAFSLFNCITVVPGAIGAWRKSDILAAGGFSVDTLAEDQDLTISIRKSGKIIAYEEHALCFTEAPDTFASLAKQRYRWGFGTLQCAWKHRGALLSRKHGSLGFVGLPNTWLFQVIFSVISPIADIVLLASLVSIMLNKIQHPVEFSVLASLGVLVYFAVFLAIDMATAYIAFKLEKEDTSLIWLLAIQRFAYRQVMYYVMLKSILTAMKGLAPGWGKLERKATVTHGFFGAKDKPGEAPKSSKEHGFPHETHAV